MEKNKTAERSFVNKLQKYLHHYCTWSGPIECKVSYKPKFNYKSGFKPHQLPNLINASRACVTYKISDISSSCGFGQLPWDLDCYYKSNALVAIQWVGSKSFYLIKPLSLLDHLSVGNKSLDEKTARELAWLIGELR